MPSLRDEVKSRGARNMPVAELEDFILELRRRTVHQHFSPSDWLIIDHLRDRAARKSRETK